MPLGFSDDDRDTRINTRTFGIKLMLWSKTIVDADTRCPSHALGLRRGIPGKKWDGYRVGAYVHDAIHATSTGDDPPDRARLSIQELVAADRILRNKESMDILVPETAVLEESRIGKIEPDGSVPGGWVEAPPWAIRGPDWDPDKADGTYFRVQPDMYFIDPEDPNTLVIYDWKTSWGMPSDDNLEKDVQSIAYCAALGEALGVENVRFVWWNIRYKVGQVCERSTAHWVALAKPIFAACYEKDQQDQGVIEEDARAGEHCGTCPYSGGCLQVADDHDSLQDGELYRYSKKIDALAKGVRSSMNSRLKTRTGPLELASDFSIVPQNKTYKRWAKGMKGEAIRSVMRAVEQSDELDFTDYFDVKGTLGSWVASLPDELAESVNGSLSESHRTVFVERKDRE